MSTLSLATTIKLRSGYSIPQLGYGVYLAEGDDCYKGVLEALKAGYRHIDSAQGYFNEEQVGAAVVASGVPRESVFITTKYWPTQEVRSTDEVFEDLRKSLKKLNPESPEPYIDLMLIHAPYGGPQARVNNWAALTRAQKEGWIRDIGVSNFSAKHLKELPAPVPAINQIQLQPFFQQKEIVAYCQEHGIVVEAYCPIKIVAANKEIVNKSALPGICKKYGKEAAQILIRWSLQKGYVPLPKSVTPSRIKSNAEVYDFELDKEDMAALDALDQGEAGSATPGWDPVNVP